MQITGPNYGPSSCHVSYLKKLDEPDTFATWMAPGRSSTQTGYEDPSVTTVLATSSVTMVLQQTGLRTGRECVWLNPSPLP